MAVKNARSSWPAKLLGNFANLVLLGNSPPNNPMMSLVSDWLVYFSYWFLFL